jgi:hypothetical protein
MSEQDKDRARENFLDAVEQMAEAGMTEQEIRDEFVYVLEVANDDGVFT